jgi:hypothetical protein
MPLVFQQDTKKGRAAAGGRTSLLYNPYRGLYAVRYYYQQW